MGSYYRSSSWGSHTGDLVPVVSVESEPTDTTGVLKRISRRMTYEYGMPFIRSRSLSPVRETTSYVRRARSVSPTRDVVLTVGEEPTKTTEPYYYYPYSYRGYYPYSYSPYYWGSYRPYYSYSYRRPSYYYRTGRWEPPTPSEMWYSGRPSYSASLDAEVESYLSKWPTSSYYSAYRSFPSSYYDYSDYWPSYSSRYSSYPRYWWYY